MRMYNLLSIVAAVAVALSASADARIISTFEAGGADAELRESNPTQNRGDNSELATRVSPTQNSVMYVKLPVASVTAFELSQPITYRLTFRNTNLPISRIADTSTNPTVVPTRYTGLQYFVLDPENPGADWLEVDTMDGAFDGIRPINAPGYSLDNNAATRGIVVGDGDFTPLGSQNFREMDFIGLQPQENHLPVGEAHDITFAPGSPLHEAIVAAQATNHQTITIASGTIHNNLDTHGNWLRFNYLFNPKEQTTLNDDSGYDSNVSAADGAEGSPFSGATNSLATPFAPQLVLTVPEPSSVVLLGLAGVASVAMLRRRK